jgi:LL-diaminopimelate aminotransferase
MSFFTDCFASRIGGASFGTSDALFKFEAIKRAKRAARAAHPDVPLLDLGVGEPDLPAFPLAVETLAREAGLAENRLYADNGIPEFKDAAASYLERAFGVTGIDPETEVMHAIGTKSAYAMLPLAFINPGDVALVTVPGYPILATHTRYLGGEVYQLPLTRERGFLPDLASIPQDTLRRAKLLYLNYPNNPTGAQATESFFREVVDFARKYHVIVVHDAAYGALVYDGRKPLSFLSIPGAKDVGVEIHSLSKSFNMTGWRLGFVAGNAEAVAAYAAVKDTVDSGQFRAIQKAGAAILAHPELTARARARYSRRLDLLVPALRAAGFDAAKSAGTFYCYTRAPIGTASGIRFPTAASFSDWLIRERLVSTVPWDDAGPFVRFSVTFETERIGGGEGTDGGEEGEIETEREVIRALTERLTSARLTFA